MKVLFIDSNLIGDNSPTGHTLKNITNGIPDCTFLQYCLDYDAKYHTPVYNVIYETKSNNFLFFIVKSLYRKILKVNTNPEHVKTSTVSDSGKESAFVIFLKMIIDMIPHHVGRHNLQKIIGFKPDVIYSLGGTITVLNMTKKLSRKLNVPVVMHIMDDWYGTLYNESIITRGGHKKATKLMDEIMEATTCNLAISEKMANYYEKKFNKPFSSVMNCIDSLHPQPLPNNDVLRFVFSGGLQGGRTESLKKIGEIIQSNSLLKGKIRLAIYTSRNYVERYKNYFDADVQLSEYVNKNKMFENLGQADVLVHVESFEQDEIDFYQYSLSTKIPEYMSVGRPILCYGPEDIGTVSYIKEKEIGIVASNLEELIEGIVLLTQDGEYREKLGRRALEVAEKEHLQQVAQKTVKNTLSEGSAKVK